MSFIEAAGWVTFWISCIALAGVGFFSLFSWMALIEDFLNDPRRWWLRFSAALLACLLGVTFVVWAFANVEHWAWVPVTL